MSDTNTNKAVARQFVDRVVNGHDLNGVDELLAANFVEHHAAPSFAANKAGPARDVPSLGYAIYHAVPNAAGPQATPSQVHRSMHEDRGGLFVKTREPDRFYLLLNEIVAQGEVNVESIAPIDDDLSAVYQYLIGSEGSA